MKYRESVKGSSQYKNIKDELEDLSKTERKIANKLQRTNDSFDSDYFKYQSKLASIIAGDFADDAESRANVASTFAMAGLEICEIANKMEYIPINEDEEINGEIDRLTRMINEDQNENN